MVVVKVLCVRWDGDRWRFCVRMLSVLTVRCVLSDIERLMVAGWGLKLGTADFCFFLDADRARAAGCMRVPASADC